MLLLLLLLLVVDVVATGVVAAAVVALLLLVFAALLWLCLLVLLLLVLLVVCYLMFAVVVCCLLCVLLLIVVVGVVVFVGVVVIVVVGCLFVCWLVGWFLGLLVRLFVRFCCCLSPASCWRHGYRIIEYMDANQTWPRMCPFVLIPSICENLVLAYFPVFQDESLKLASRLAPPPLTSHPCILLKTAPRRKKQLCRTNSWQSRMPNFEGSTGTKLGRGQPSQPNHPSLQGKTLLREGKAHRTSFVSSHKAHVCSHVLQCKLRPAT